MRTLLLMARKDLIRKARSPVGVLDCRGVPWRLSTMGPDRDGHGRLVAATDQGRLLIAAVVE